MVRLMNTLNIGHILYRERKKRQLTQREFVGEIVSVSQYSRVESGEQDLRASTFLKLLQYQHININNFLNSESDTDTNSLEDKQLNELAIAFYNHDIDKVNKIKNKANNGYKNNVLLLDATLMESILENKLDQLDSDIKEKFSQRLSDADDWTTNKLFLQLFGSSMMIFNIERLNVYMSKILKVYIRKIDQCSFEIQRRIGAICVNYLGRIYQDKDTRLLNQTLKLLNKISPTPDLLMYRLLGKYFEALFNKNQMKVDSILDTLKLAGYEKFVVNLPK